jgi:hypothetical protein
LSRFKASRDQVHQSEFADVHEVLVGPSRWKEFIEPNLKTAKAAKHTFEVLPKEEYQRKTDHGDNTPGVTIKSQGAIFMLEWGKKNTSFLSAVLHECVHWVSDPAKQGAESTARQAMGKGIMEGLVELITREILAGQNITKPEPNLLGHVDRVPVVEELLRIIDYRLFAKALFRGELDPFVKSMEFTFSVIGFGHIKAFTTANKQQHALNEIRKWRTSEEERRKLGNIAPPQPPQPPAPQYP